MGGTGHPRDVKGARPAPGASLLVVDDDFQLRELYQVVMESVGHRVRLARDGQQCLDLYRQALAEGRPYDLVLLDLNMPVMDGRQCLEEIYNLDPRARVLLATGSPEDDLGPWSRRLVGMLTKPVGVTGILEGVARALEANAPS